MRARALELVRGALAAIEASRSRIDDLNVYPVPDGDTGTNLTLTVRAVLEALESSTTEDRAGLAREISRAALMGARGNSGVILSQIIRGAVESFGASDALAPAFRSASDAAYRAVRKPVEGTMLTAIRELAEEAEAGGDLAAIIARGEACVARTPQLLPVLAEAGVVDAGAAGLVEIVRGLAAAALHRPLESSAHLSAPPRVAGSSLATLDSIHEAGSGYRYCTALVVEGEHLDADALEAELDLLGDSLLVVGDPSALKIHVHTDDPGRVLSAAVARGTIAGVEIADMVVQTRGREERLLRAVPGALSGLVAVAAGAGNRALFESLGAVVVDGGRTMNPSIAELLSAIESTDADEVILLPNDRNVVLTSEQAAAAATRPVVVLPTWTVQAGLAAAVAFSPEATRAANVDEMAGAAAGVVTGAITIASRDVESNGLEIREGEWLGLVDGVPIAGGESFAAVTRLVIEALLEHPRSLLTLLTGEEPQPLDELLSELVASHPELELEIHAGGQPNYALLLGAE